MLPTLSFTSRTHSITALCLLFSTILWCSTLSADVEKEKLEIYDLGFVDKGYMSKQVERIDDLARAELGMQVHGDKSDLELLQRIVNKGLIKRDNHLMLQAMGAVLGNILANEPTLEWKIYEDRVGRSRALCIEDSENCLFPMTMLSRRMEVGIIVNVRDVYRKAYSLVEPHLPKSPYSVSNSL